MIIGITAVVTGLIFIVLTALAGYYHEEVRDGKRLFKIAPPIYYVVLASTVALFAGFTFVILPTTQNSLWISILVESAFLIIGCSTAVYIKRMRIILDETSISVNVFHSRTVPYKQITKIIVVRNPRGKLAKIYDVNNRKLTISGWVVDFEGLVSALHAACPSAKYLEQGLG